MEGSLRKEMNLVAFSALWFCKFVVPTKKFDSICPSIFETASLMAHRERFELTIPVLWDFYRSWKEILTSLCLSTSDIVFTIQCLWMDSEYFDTYCQACHYNNTSKCKIAGERMDKYIDLIGA